MGKIGQDVTFNDASDYISSLLLTFFENSDLF